MLRIVLAEKVYEPETPPGTAAPTPRLMVEVALTYPTVVLALSAIWNILGKFAVVGPVAPEPEFDTLAVNVSAVPLYQ